MKAPTMQASSCGCSSVDRVLASEAKGRGFDPRQPHQTTVSQRVKTSQTRMLIGVAGLSCSKRFHLIP